MCTTNELRSLIRELLHHIEQVALLSAKIQFKDENKQQKPNEYITCCEKTNNYRNNSILNTRFNQLFRFHSAYMKYFVFALDPYAEVIVPLTSSPLTLFITNILAKVSPQRQTASTHQTSKSIIEFLQIISAELVQSLYLKFRKNLIDIMNEMKMPYDLDTLTKLRHECFRKSFTKPQTIQIELEQRPRVQFFGGQKSNLFLSTATTSTASANADFASTSMDSSITAKNESLPDLFAVSMPSSTSGQPQTIVEHPTSHVAYEVDVISNEINSTEMKLEQTNDIDTLIPVYFIASNGPVSVEIPTDGRDLNIMTENNDDYTILTLN